MEALKNHPLLETGQVSKSSLDVAVLYTQAKVTVGEGKMPARYALTTGRPYYKRLGPRLFPTIPPTRVWRSS